MSDKEAPERSSAKPKIKIRCRVCAEIPGSILCYDCEQRAKRRRREATKDE